MDLTEISRRQALKDLDIANIRIVDVSCRLAEAVQRLQGLRDKVSDLEVALRSEARAPEPEAQLKLTPTVVTSSKDQSSGRGRSVLRQLLSPRQANRPGLMANIDQICGYVLSGSKPRRRIALSRSEFGTFQISGWAFPRNGSGSFGSIEVVLRGTAKTVAAKVAPTLRDDVAAHFSNPAASMCGFLVEFPMMELVPDTYSIELHGETPVGEVMTEEVLVLDLH